MLTPNASLSREIHAIRNAIRLLSSAFAEVDVTLAGVTSANWTGPVEVGRTRKKRTLTPARRNALKLQGKYIGTIRMLPAAKKAKVKKIRDTKGVRAAIAYARRLAS